MTNQELIRPEITNPQIIDAMETLRTRLDYHLILKGPGAFLSRHEILGVVTEEYHETINAVQNESLQRVKEELIDIAAACVFGCACIDAGATQW